MTDEKRKQTIDSWHARAGAYEILVQNHRIFTDMAMGLIEFVKQNSIDHQNDLHIMDLAAGTGLISKLLIEHIHIPPSSLYLVEPAEQMCIIAGNNIKTPHIYQTAAEDCLTTGNLPRDFFDFILCNASMHLMSETNIYPIVSKLLKPNKGYFLYTLWYHSFDETQQFDQDDQLEAVINDALMLFDYPKYYTSNSQRSTNRSRRYLEETAYRNGLRLQSCKIYMHQIPLNFDLEFMLMTRNWLIEHLKTHQSTENEDVYLIRERIIERVRDLIKDKYTEKPIVQVIVSRISS